MKKEEIIETIENYVPHDKEWVHTLWREWPHSLRHIAATIGREEWEHQWLIGDSDSELIAFLDGNGFRIQEDRENCHCPRYWLCFERCENV